MNSNTFTRVELNKHDNNIRINEIDKVIENIDKTYRGISITRSVNMENQMYIDGILKGLQTVSNELRKRKKEILDAERWENA